MKIIILVCLMISSSAFGLDPMAYPKSPDPKLTPGSLCETPDSYRYSEQIPYCERAVNSFMKELVFISYRKNLGYRLNSDRSNFKVDHFIPLCAGGSNKENNLWPQHVSLSKVTDIIESQGCEKLGEGLISQKDLINLVVKAKMNVSEAPKILKYIRKLR